MFPELFYFSSRFGFPSYFFLLITGFLFATAVAVRWARRIGQNPDVMVDLGLSSLLFGILGARLLSVLADGYFWDYVHLCTDPNQVSWKIERTLCLAHNQGVWDFARGVCHPKERDCLAWAKFWTGGLAYYGGFIGALLAAVFQLKRDRFSFWKASDMAGFVAPLGLAFGRMGCLLAGCCFGNVSNKPWALSFPPYSPASEVQFRLGALSSVRQGSHPVHPTQIYESLMSLGIAAICMMYVHPRKRYDGHVFVVFIILYAVGRFLLEFLRADDRGGLFSLSTSQWLGVILIGFALVLHLKRSPKTVLDKSIR